MTLRQMDEMENTANANLLIEKAKEEKALAAEIAEMVKDKIFTGSMQLDVSNAKAIGNLMLLTEKIIADNNLSKKLLEDDKKLLNAFTKVMYEEVKEWGVENITSEKVAKMLEISTGEKVSLAA